MATVCKEGMCNGCGACAAVCPKECVTLNKTIYCYNAVIDKAKCVECEKCKKVCPNLNKIEMREPIAYYQGWNKQSTRKMSSSGGVAYALMEETIKTGGYVAGCLFENGEFIFDITNDSKRIKRFVGSKYVKSDPTSIYERIKEIVKNNIVLFIGLPCQIAGIKMYLGKTENLITIDLICHGSPSPQMLNYFLKDKKLDIKQIKDIKFRKKARYGLIIDDNRIAISNTIDDYTYAFLRGLDYTQNCYSCQYATVGRCSDITLGDSWGTEYSEAEPKGISLVLIQTERGYDLLKSANIELLNVNTKHAVANNKQLMHPSVEPQGRINFLKLIEQNVGFRRALLKVAPISTLKRIAKEAVMHIIKRK